MHLIIRAKGEYDAAVLQGALEGSRHLVVTASKDDTINVPADAEFLSMSMAEALGLSPPTQVLKIAIVPKPSDVTWINARFIVIGMILDRNYDKKQELEILLNKICKEVSRFNSLAKVKIHSLGIHQDLLNMSELPLPHVADAILKEIG